MATIRDVAMAAEVSVATVSRVMNNSGYVSEETRKKVERAVEKLNYKPNAVARSLFKKQSKTIALILPDIKNPFFPEVARGVEDLLNSREYTLLLCNSDEDIEKEINYMEMIEQKYVDGVIIVTSTLTPKHIKSAAVPVVALDRPIGENVPSVSVNNFEGARQAVRHLKSAGCKRIAHIRGPVNVINSDDRYKGYLEEVENESWFDHRYVVPGEFDVQKTAEATMRLLTENPEIDGIFAGNDYMAMGVMKAARKLGIRVPEELSVIGFDGIEMGQLTNPEMTTMAQPIYDLGKTAAELLLQIIKGKNVAKKHYEFEVELIAGQTTLRKG